LGWQFFASLKANFPSKALACSEYFQFPFIAFIKCSQFLQITQKSKLALSKLHILVYKRTLTRHLLLVKTLLAKSLLHSNILNGKTGQLFRFHNVILPRRRRNLSKTISVFR
jgi:hypothetical protein